MARRFRLLVHFFKSYRRLFLITLVLFSYIFAGGALFHFIERPYLEGQCDQFDEHLGV